MNPYFYKVNLDRVVDGDSVDCIFDLGFNIKYKVRVRLVNLDAPETWRPVSNLEYVAGTKVKEFLNELLSKHAGNLYCFSSNIDLYGRSSGTLYYREGSEYININLLVSEFIAANNLQKSQFYSK